MVTSRLPGRGTPAGRTAPWRAVWALAALALPGIGCGETPETESTSWSWDFEVSQPGTTPEGFSAARTGEGRPAVWSVVIDDGSPAGSKVLTQTDLDPTSYRLPVAVAPAPPLADVELRVRCRMIEGEIDRGCGLVFRYRDADRYYVTRANVLEDNVRLYRVIDGERQQIAHWSGEVSGEDWHELGVEVRGPTLRVLWDGETILEHHDEAIPEAGRVGLWTKADSRTHFDDLRVSALSP